MPQNSTFAPGSGLRVICATRNRGNRGTEKMTGIYLQALLSAGHDAALMLPHDALLVDKMQQQGLSDRLFLLPLGWRGRMVLSPRFRRRVQKLLLGADLLLVHNALLASAFRLVTEVPIVAVNHMDKVKRMSDSDSVIVLNRTMCQELTEGDFRAVPERVLHLANGLWQLPDSPAPPPAGPVPVVGFLGALEKVKGCFDLLEAVSLMDRPRPKLIFAGEGSALKELRRRTARMQAAQTQAERMQVEFAGYVDDLSAFFAACDIICLPSQAEPFGLTVLEAMAAGRPVVSTRTSGVRDILQHETNGLLAAPGRPDQLAQLLGRLTADRALCARLGENARHTAQERFGPEAFTCNLSDTVRRAVALGRR